MTSKSRVTWFLDARSLSRRKVRQAAQVGSIPAPASSLSRCNLDQPRTRLRLGALMPPITLPCFSLPAGSSVDHPRQTVRASHSRRALCQNPLTTHHSRVPEPPSAEPQAHQSASATVAGLILGIKGLGHSPQQWKRGQGTRPEQETPCSNNPFANGVSAAVLSQTESGLKPANHFTRRQIPISIRTGCRRQKSSHLVALPALPHRFVEFGKQASLPCRAQKELSDSEDHHWAHLSRQLSSPNHLKTVIQKTSNNDSHGQRVTAISILKDARPRVAGEDTRVTHSSTTGGGNPKQPSETCVSRHHGRCSHGTPQASAQPLPGQDARTAQLKRAHERPQRRRRQIAQHSRASGAF